MYFLIFGTKAIGAKDFELSAKPVVKKTYPNVKLGSLLQSDLTSRVTNLTEVRGVYSRISNDQGLQDVDGALVVSSDWGKSGRQSVADFWKNKVQVFKALSVVEKVAAVAAVVGAVALFILGAKIFIPLALIGGAAALIGLGILSSRRSSQAAEQVRLWSLSPGEYVAEKRSEYFFKLASQMSRHYGGEAIEVERDDSPYFADINAVLLSSGKQEYAACQWDASYAASLRPYQQPAPQAAMVTETSPLLPPPPLVTPPLVQ